MGEARIGIRTELYNHGVLGSDFEQYLNFEKGHTKIKLGEKIIEHLLGLKTPCVVRINESLEPIFRAWDDKHLVYSLIVDFNPVEMVHVKMLELPPFEFIAPYTNKQTIEWQCDYCGQVNLVAEHLECRKCGAPRKVLR